jgi:hypothetical protein
MVTAFARRLPWPAMCAELLSGDGRTSMRGFHDLGSVMCVTNPGRTTAAQQLAVATHSWEQAECDEPCPCGTADCGHGQPCPAEDCEGHDVHTMRNPTTQSDVTARQDSLDCCEGRSSSSRNITLPDCPWGTVSLDGTVTVLAGVTHYELGV